MLVGQVAARIQRREPRRATPPPSSARSAAPAPRAAARGRRHQRATTQKLARRAATCVAACSSEMGRPSHREHLERALDALRIVGVDARRRGADRRRQPRVHGRPADARGLGIDVGADCSARPRGSAAMPPISARRYSIVPPTSSGTSPARFDVGDGTRRVAHELPRRIARAGLDQIDAGDAARPRAFPRAAWRCRCRARDTPAPSRRSRSRSETRAPAAARSRSCPCPWARSAPRWGCRVPLDGRGRIIGRAGTCGRARQAHLRPGRPAVIALVGARRLLHLAQQRIHLRQRQPAVRVDRRTAGDGA